MFGLSALTPDSRCNCSMAHGTCQAAELSSILDPLAWLPPALPPLELQRKSCGA